MLFIISSSPDSEEFKTALRMAGDADLCLIHDAVYLAMEETIPNTGRIYAIKDTGRIYAIKDDLSLRGIKEPRLRGLTIIDHAEMVDIMAKAEKVIGAF